MCLCDQHLSFTRHSGLLRTVVAATLLAPLLTLTGGGTIRAEDVVDPAFQQQWQTTDAAVAQGEARRTFFWGPEPFAHTAEVYAESPNQRQRRVQYFDKARMELTRRPGDPPNLVTNGLLTVELVAGRLQVGDTTFLQRSPAAIPVAGDPVDNDTTPTYASFHQGKLARGVPGAVAAADRTGQPIVEAVDRAGVVSRLAQPPAPVRYRRYFAETDHNIADVFYDFFLAVPLGEARWLPVMGYPITEPFWTKEPVVVAGQPRAVLVQLFERRALTYTPANPAGWQVEMSNIGQHYYRWRYGVDERDPVPGSYRLLRVQDRSLYSTSIRDAADTVKLGEAPATITDLWTMSANRAVLTTESGGVYLADLTRPRAFRSLNLPAGLGQATVEAVSASADGRLLALQLRPSSQSRTVVQVYRVGTLADGTIQLRDTFTAYDAADDRVYPPPYRGQRLAPAGDYLAVLNGRVLHLVDLVKRSSTSLTLSDAAEITRADWIGHTSQMLVSTGGFDTYDGTTDGYTNTPGAVVLVDAPSGTARTLLHGPRIRSAAVSPDGQYFAVQSSKERFLGRGIEGTQYRSTISFRALANPTVELAPIYEQGTAGRRSSEVVPGEWSADGTYLVVRSWSSFTAGSSRVDINLVSLVTGQPIQQNTLDGNYNSHEDLQLAGPFYTMTAIHMYNGPDRPTTESIVVKNIDGSESVTLFEAQVTPNRPHNRVPMRTAQVVQVIPE